MQSNNNPLIFVVEDNHIYNNLVVSFLKSNKFTNIESYLTGEEAVANLHKKPVIVVQDYLLDKMTGIDVLVKAKKIHPEIEFIFLSGQDSIEVAIDSIKYGAYDYIVKDQMALKKLVHKIHKIISVQELKKKNERYKVGVILFFVVLSLFILVLIVWAILNPGTFGL